MELTSTLCVVTITTLLEAQMKTEKIFTFRIPVELLDAGHALAEKYDLSLAQLMRRILKDAVEADRCLEVVK
jgi:predicted HicB family RNase H-like nuclease